MVWNLLEYDPFQNHNLSLNAYLFPDKQDDSLFWHRQLEERFPEKLSRLKQVAAIIRSPLAFHANVDIDEEISHLRLANRELSSSQEYALSKLLKYHGRIAESKLHLAAAGDSQDARLEMAIDDFDAGNFETAARMFDECLESGREVSLQLMLSGQCYRGLDQIRNAALRETVAFAHWRRSYRNSQDIVAFRELDKLDLLTGFFLVTVYLPDNQTVSNESYRALLAQSVREQSPLDGARHLRIYVVDAFGNEDFSKIARPLYWAELAREIQLDQAAADIALGNTDVAVESMIAVNEFRPGDPGLGEKMVAALDQAGARQSADHLFESISRFYFRTLKKYPRSPLHHNNYAWICARAGRQLTPALRHGMVAIAERPLTTNYLDTLAEVYFHLGEPDSAAELSQRCTQIAPRKRHYQNQFRRFSRQH